jgi:tRNA (cmo5U34)-methyltransferase
MPNSWVDIEKANEFLARADRLPHRGEGEVVLVRDLARALPGRVLDLGCGDGRLTALVLAAYPGSHALCVDMSPPMLAAASARFEGHERVSVVTHDFELELPFDGPFDAVVTSLAVHHVTDDRKRTLYAEVAELLAPGGVFCNLDIVTSPTQALHDQWREEMNARDDAGDVLCDMSAQLEWMRAAGLDDVDCIWKWRSLALMRGERPTAEASRVNPSGVDARLARGGGLSYLHIPAADVGESARFYEVVFGWNIRGHDTARPSFDDGSGHVAGAWISTHAISREPGFLPYVYVDRVNEVVERIRAHGGEIVDDPAPEGNLRIATFRDPAGNLIGLWQETEDPA